MSSDKRALMKSALRQSRRNRNWMGYWLHKQRIREKLKVSEQSRAARLFLYRNWFL
jgi:hypothetical protein